MADKVAKERISVITIANREYNRENHLPIEIEEKCTWGTNKVEFGINWAAIGTVDSEKAYEFADYMRFIAKLVDELNKLDLEYDWNGNDPWIKDIDTYREAHDKVLKMFNERRGARIARFLEDGII